MAEGWRTFSSALFVFATMKCGMGYTSDDVSALQTALFSNYSTNIRPKFNQSEKTEVFIRMELYAINEFDITSGNMIASGQFYISWLDEFLIWNASEYGGLNQLTIKRGQYWAPEIAVLFGSRSNSGVGEEALAPSQVVNTGQVFWFPAHLFSVRCMVDVSIFPFDVHICDFSIILTEYDARHAVLIAAKNAIDQNFYTENGEWNILSSIMKDGVLVDNETSIAASIVKIHLKVARLPGFVIIHSIIPIFFVCILNTLNVFLPVDSGERITFCITLQLAFIFLLSGLRDALPNNSRQTTAFSAGFLAVNILSSMCVAWSIFVVYLSKNADRGIPVYPWLLRASKMIARFSAKHRKVAATNENHTSRSALSVKDITEHKDEDEQYSTAPQESPLKHDEAPGREIHLTWTGIIEILDRFQFVVILIALTACSLIFIIPLAVKYRARYDPLE